MMLSKKKNHNILVHFLNDIYIYHKLSQPVSMYGGLVPSLQFREWQAELVRELSVLNM